MRALLSGEKLLAIGGDVDVYIKLLVENGSGTPINVGAALGTHWIINATWGETLDTPVSSATFTIVQQIGANSLAPLIATSVLNTLDDGITYSPQFDIGRHVWAYSATVPRGAAFNPSTTTLWRLIFEGRIDDYSSADSQEMLGPITLTCSDLGAWLMDTQIETEGRQFGTTPVGTPLETVMQGIITAYTPVGEPAVTLLKTSASNYAVTDWKQGATKIMEALQSLVLDTTGEDVRYRFDASHVSQLTWTNPDRGRTSVDATIGTDEAIITTLGLSLANVRNAIEMSYTDPASGESGTVTSEDATSIAKYRRRFNRIGSSVMIGTSAEATAVTAAVVSDLSDAPAQFSASCHYLWFTQLYDRYTFTANGRQFTDDQTLGVAGYQHAVENGRAATTLTLAGRVVGAYAAWVRRLVTTSTKINVFSTIDILRINSRESVDGKTRDFTVLVGNRVLDLYVHHRTVAITETNDWHDFSDTAVLVADADSPLVLHPSHNVVTFSIEQPTSGNALAIRMIPYASGMSAGASALVTVDAAPPAINATIHATKVVGTATARLSIDIAFGPSDGPVSVAVIERINGTPTTILTHAMAASGTIDWAGYVALDARAIPATSDSISWTAQITDVAGHVWTFGPTYALAPAVLITPTFVESAGSATVTVVVVDAGGYLDKTHVDTAVAPATGSVTGQISWHVTRVGGTTIERCTTAPAPGTTTGTYTFTKALDPLHIIQVEGFIHYVDGDTESIGQWPFDSDKIADVVNVAVANESLVAKVTVCWDSDALVGANCARYSVDGGAWVSTVAISGAYLSQFTVAQTSARQSVVIQAKNAVDAGATWGHQTTVEIDALYVELPGPSLTVTPTPGPTAYSLAWSGSAGITVSIDGTAYATPSASPITVTRTSADITYAFKATLNGQDVTNEITIPSLEKDTVTPDLTVVPSAPATTTLSFTVTATNPGGGSAPTIAITLVGCTAVGYVSGDPVTSGAVVVVNRPAFGTTAQATVTFKATIAGGGAESISRTVQNQVKAAFGPSLDVKATPGATSTADYTITWTGSAGTTVSINGAAYGTPAASPFAVARNAINGTDKTYTFKSAVIDGQTVSDMVTIPAIGAVDTNTVACDLSVVPGTPAAATQPFTITGTNPTGGAAPTIKFRLTGCTGSGYSADTDYTISTGTVVTVNRPVSTQTTQAHIRVWAYITGGTTEEIDRTIPAQLNVGPSLEVTVTPGDTSYSIAYSATGTLTLSINDVSGGAYLTPGGSPLTANRNPYLGATRTYDFKCIADGQTVGRTIPIPPIATNSAASFSVSTVTGDDTTDIYTYAWTASGFPSGTTFNLRYKMTATGGSVIEGVIDGATSGGTLAAGADIGGSAKYIVTVDAVCNGVLVASKSKAGTVPI